MARPKKELSGDAAERKKVDYMLQGRLVGRLRKYLKEEGGTEASVHRASLDQFLTSKGY